MSVIRNQRPPIDRNVYLNRSCLGNYFTTSVTRLCWRKTKLSKLIRKQIIITVIYGEILKLLLLLPVMNLLGANKSFAIPSDL